MTATSKRKAIDLPTRRAILHESGYRCGNPGCRAIITLDIHHIEHVANGGGNGPENLLPLCPTCHALHHAGQIPLESVRTWKMLLLSLNDGFPRLALDQLLALHHIGSRPLLVSIEMVLAMGSLIASGLLAVEHPSRGDIPERDFSQTRFISLSDKGRAFVRAWIAGRQADAVGVGPDVVSPIVPRK